MVPVAGMVFDVAFKVYANLFFPTQTQIHVELFVEELKKKEREAKTLGAGEPSP